MKYLAKDEKQLNFNACYFLVYSKRQIFCALAQLEVSLKAVLLWADEMTEMVLNWMIFKGRI